MTETSKSGELIVAPDAGVTYNLDAFPEDKYNRLIPTQTIRMPTDLMVPVVQIVALNATDEVAGDTYKSNDVPAGRRALSRVGLRKLSTAAGVNVIGEERLDDGSKPGTCGVRITAEMTLPTGQRLRSTSSRWIDVERMAWSSPAQKGKFLAFLYEHCASRAENRAIRALLSLRSSYAIADLAKPFAVVSFAPNMNHPEVRERILDAMAPTVAQLYGPTPALAAGPVVNVPEAPEDDAPAAASGAGDPDPAPDWFGVAATPAASAQPAENVLVTILREKAASSGLVGPATASQKARLQEIFRPLGLQLTAAGLARVFALAALGAITSAQANALIEVSADATFADLWREMVAEGREAAACAS